MERLAAVTQRSPKILDILKYVQANCFTDPPPCLYIYQSGSLLCGTAVFSLLPPLFTPLCHWPQTWPDTRGGRHSSEPLTPSEGKPPLTPQRCVRSQPHWLTGPVCCCSPPSDYMGLLWMLSHSCHAIVTWPRMKGSPQLCRAERTDRHMGRYETHMCNVEDHEKNNETRTALTYTEAAKARRKHI